MLNIAETPTLSPPMGGDVETIAPTVAKGSFGLAPSKSILKVGRAQGATIRVAEAFDLDPITRRYCRDYEVPLEVGESRAKELKRFLALCALNPDEAYGMYGPVDIMWHTFIFFTKNYHNFCDQVAGHYLHHVPGSAAPGHLNPNAYRQMLTDYEYIFGETPPREHWPISTQLKKQSNGTIEAVGDDSCNGNCVMDCVTDCGVECVSDCVDCVIDPARPAVAQSGERI